jgi:hypothetical protein
MPSTPTEVFRHVVKIKAAIDAPISVNLFDGPPFETVCEIMYCINGEHRIVPAGFAFDGATIPRFLWSLAGFSPLDRDTLLSSCIHDWLLTRRSMPRVMADAWFVSTLSGASLNGRNLPQCGPKRARLMYAGVRAWSILSGFLRARTDDAPSAKDGK